MNSEEGDMPELARGGFIEQVGKNLELEGKGFVHMK